MPSVIVNGETVQVRFSRSEKALDPDVEHRDVHRSTDPAAALIDASQSAQLVVVGAHHRNPLTALLLRSVSASVVEHTGPVTVMEAEVAGLLVATPAVAMAVTISAGEVLAALGLLSWVIPLLVWITRDVSHAMHHVQLPHDRHPDRPHAGRIADHQVEVRR